MEIVLVNEVVMVHEQFRQPSFAGQTGSVAGDRPLLMNVAYRMLSSVADAQDAVQESYARWYALSEWKRREVESPTAWLVKVVTRICLDVLGSAKVRREQYVGPWLPEPLPGSAQWSSHGDHSVPGDPADRLVLDESVSMALLVVLESMTPAERVAFVLHDVFRYSFAEIGAIVDRSPGACRQLASSARRRVHRARITPAAVRQHADVVSAFRAAWETGDLTALVSLLDPDATAITDGGGLVRASLEPILGADTVARFFIGVFNRQAGLTVIEAPINGEPGLVARAGSDVLATIAFNVANDRVTHIWVVRNPEKLAPWAT